MTHSLSALEVDHILRCKVENILEELEDLDSDQDEIIRRNFRNALTAINDELYELEP